MKFRFDRKLFRRFAERRVVNGSARLPVSSSPTVSQKKNELDIVDMGTLNSSHNELPQEVEGWMRLRHTM